MWKLGLPKPGWSLNLLLMSHQNTEQQSAAYCPRFFFGLCNLGVALSNVYLSDPVELFSPHQPASAAGGEGVASAP